MSAWTFPNLVLLLSSKRNTGVLPPLIRPHWFDRPAGYFTFNVFLPVPLLSLWLDLKVCCGFVIVNKHCFCLRYIFSHQNALCGSFRANRHVECISYPGICMFWNLHHSNLMRSSSSPLLLARCSPLLCTTATASQEQRDVAAEPQTP